MDRIFLFLIEIGIFPKSILVFVDFVIVIRMKASLYLLNALAWAPKIK